MVSVQPSKEFKTWYQMQAKECTTIVSGTAAKRIHHMVYQVQPKECTTMVSCTLKDAH